MYIILFVRVSMLFGTFTTALSIPQTSFPGSTNAIVPQASMAAGCPVSCSRDPEGVPYISWQQKQITATITAETLIHIINRKTNNTRTTVITNTEADLAGYTPMTDTNGAGTRTTTFVETSGLVVTTHVVTFPSFFYKDYPTTYRLCGTLPTVVKGSSTCFEHSCGKVFNYDSLMAAPPFTWPSHPALPTAIKPRTMSASEVAADPKGLTYEPVWANNQSDYAQRLAPIFPDLGVWKCQNMTSENGDEVKEAALYVTQTSTSTEADEDSPTQLPSTQNLYRFEAAATRAAITPPTSFAAPQPSPGVPPQDVHTTYQSGGQLPYPPKHQEEAGHLVAPQAEKVQEPSHNAASEPIDETSPLSKPQMPEGLPTVVWMPEDAQSVSVALDKPKDMSGQVAKAQDSPQEGSPIHFNGQTLSVDADNHLGIGEQTLVPNIPLTINSVPTAASIILHTSNNQNVLVVGSSSTTLAGSPTSPPALTIGSEVIPPDSQDEYVVGGQTLVPIDHALVPSTAAATSLSASATQGTSTSGLGGYIMTGFGSGPSSKATGTQAFQGAALRNWASPRLALVFGIIFVLFCY